MGRLCSTLTATVPPLLKIPQICLAPIRAPPSAPDQLSGTAELRSTPKVAPSANCHIASLECVPKGGEERENRTQDDDSRSDRGLRGVARRADPAGAGGPRAQARADAQRAGPVPA